MLTVFALFAAACGDTAPAPPDPADPASSLPRPEVGDEPALAGEHERREAVFAGGCFWCVEAVFEQLAGVYGVTSGYAGGRADEASYQAVASGQTDHAEVVHIAYDPARISYATLLRVFFATHDPTQLNRQGPDRGRQYRSAVFYAHDWQREQAQAYIDQLNEAGIYPQPIVTTLEPLAAFFPAEAFHQDFVANNPDHPYVRAWALPKIEKVQDTFGDALREE
ncbi:MAG: peptide-methionine (S)-S-oxide reductase MsrA [Phycisphaeraceae bacterium]